MQMSSESTFACLRVGKLKTNNRLKLDLRDDGCGVNQHLRGELEEALVKTNYIVPCTPRVYPDCVLIMLTNAHTGQLFNVA